MSTQKRLQTLENSIREMMSEYKNGQMGVPKEVADEVANALETILFVHELEKIDVNEINNILGVAK